MARIKSGPRRRYEITWLNCDHGLFEATRCRVRITRARRWRMQNSQWEVF